MSKKISELDKFNMALPEGYGETMYIPAIHKSSGIWKNVKVDWNKFESFIKNEIEEVKTELVKNIDVNATNISNLSTTVANTIDTTTIPGNKGKVLITSETSGKITTSNIIISELNCLQDVKSNIQSQIDSLETNVNNLFQTTALMPGFPNYFNADGTTIEPFWDTWKEELNSDEHRFGIYATGSKLDYKDKEHEKVFGSDGWLYIYCSRFLYDLDKDPNSVNNGTQNHCTFHGYLFDSENRKVMRISEGGIFTGNHEAGSFLLPVQKGYKLHRVNMAVCQCYFFPSLA